MRRVPVRPGLLERLRNAVVADDALDEWLHEAPPCEGLEQRILAESLTDEALDAALCDVPFAAANDKDKANKPDSSQAAGVVERLRAALIEDVLSDAVLDKAVKDVDPPDALVSSSLEGDLFDAERLPQIDIKIDEVEAARGDGAWNQTEASSEVIQNYQVHLRRRRWQSRGAGAMAGCSALTLLALVLYQVAAWTIPQTRAVLAINSTSSLELDSQLHGEQPVLIQQESLTEPAPAAAPTLRVELADFQPPSPGVLGDMNSELASVDLNLDTWSARIEHVGYPDRDLRHGELVSVLGPVAGAPMAVRGYDRAFHWRHGVSPWLPTATSPKQQLSLHAEPDAFAHVLDRKAKGRHVESAEVRVEDALALRLVRASLPSPGQVAVQTSGGPSVFGEAGAGLLQLTTAVGSPVSQQVVPLHWVVLLDLSQETTRQQLHRTCRALFDAARLLRDQDRLTLVALGGEPRVLCERATKRELRPLYELVLSQECDGIADWGRALPVGVRASLENSEAMRQELTILGSGAAEWAPAAEPWMDRLMADAQQRQVKVRFRSLEGEVDNRMAAWLDRNGIDWQAGEPHLNDGLVQAVTGVVAPVVRDVRLSVEFNPKAVWAYRVVGQDGSASEWSESPQAVFMRPGETHASLIELRWAPGDEDTVGWAEATWTDERGRKRSRRQRISRLQFASSFSQSSADLQTAAMLAEAAQVWRESPFAVGGVERLDRLRQAQWECSPEVRDSYEIGLLMEAVGAASDESNGSQTGDTR